MTGHFHQTRLTAILFSVAVFTSVFNTNLIAQAQYAAPTADDSKDFRTDIEFEVIMPQEGTAGYIAQQWAQDFGNLGVDIRFRQRLLEDKPSITEKVTGRWRRVKVLGEMSRDGTLSFPDKKFKPADLRLLREWVEELKTYGAQGAPSGQPAWGLSKSQFESLNRQLSAPAKFKTSIAEFSLLEAIDELLSEEGELTWNLSEQARDELMSALTNSPVLPDVTGMAKGTALAILLKSHGLVFVPQRLPDSSIVLKIEASSKEEKGWPVGWDLETIGLKRLETAPDLFRMKLIKIVDTPLTELASQASTESKVPVLIDRHALASEQIDPDALMINIPEKRTAWAMALGTATTPHRLQSNLKIDEAGKPFVWIDVFVPVRAIE